MSDATVTAEPVPVSDDGSPSATGWYGKVPARGDFVARRCPAPFRAPWDAWLAQGMLAGERAFGERWSDTFLAFPVWRFVGTAGAPPAWWAGLLAPGADQVGRLFPLTIVRPLAADPDGLPPFEALDRWMDTLEAALYALLDDDDVDAFDRALVAAAPEAVRAPLRSDTAVLAGRAAAMLAGTMSGSSPADLAVAATPAQLAQALALRALGAGERPVTWFWRSDDTGAATTRVHVGAPDPQAFVALVRGG